MTEPTRRAPLSADLLPASGAWRPGDPAGGRRFLTLPPERSFVLEGGGQLRGVTIAYESWGELDADASNAVLVCHALTGDSHAAGRSGPGHPTEGWWDPLIGPGRALDTDRLFVVCVNVLGGCQGTTGPSSIDPATGAPFGSSFPVVSTATSCAPRPRSPTTWASGAGSPWSGAPWAGCRPSSGA
jgi:homoserine O-acetyltransferase